MLQEFIKMTPGFHFTFHHVSTVGAFFEKCSRLPIQAIRRPDIHVEISGKVSRGFPQLRCMEHYPEAYVYAGLSKGLPKHETENCASYIYSVYIYIYISLPSLNL